MKIMLRTITETRVFVETCTVPDTQKLEFVNKDGKGKRRALVGKPLLDVIEDWRDATITESALLTSSQAADDDA